jgi:hypothetical protein
VGGLDELRILYRAGRLIPFVGAGVSRSVEWGDNKRGPSWEEVVNEAARQLGFTNPELLRFRGTDLQILEYFNERHGSLWPLITWLIRELNPPDETLRASPIHRELASMRASRLFYTTNFDDFIERSFVLNGRACRAVAIEREIGLTDSETVEIVKFHGDLQHPEQMVLSESQFERRLRLLSEMDARFRADLLGRALLFVGYSFRDPNVAYLFRIINEEFRELPNNPSGRRAYIVVADPSDFERRLFQARNIDVIGVRGSNMTASIAKLLREIRS